MRQRVILLIPMCALLLNSGYVFAQSENLQTRVDLVAVGRIDGDQQDLSGLDGTLETDSPANQLGGFSAIDYLGEGDWYFVLSDRGPGDGAATFACRVHEFELQIDATAKRIQPLLRKTILLKNTNGGQLNGSLAALQVATEQVPAQQVAKPISESLAFDCEGLRSLDKKSIVISDEYGPSVRMFDLQGRQVQRWVIPAEFNLCSDPSAERAVGAYPNRGLEGLALSSDGARLIAAMQGPLVQDGVVESEKCLGVNTRWLVFDSRKADAATKQLVYPLTDESTGVSEVLAVDADRYLVLERDSSAGVDAKLKHIYLANTRDATDVTSVARLNRSGLPANVNPISKRLLIDLREERFGLGGALTAGKPEGLTWGPTLADGRRLLIVCVDNDFKVEKQSEFYAFAVAL